MEAGQSWVTTMIGQPPEVLKGLLLNNIRNFDTLVLCDTHEKDGSLLNNLEFPQFGYLIRKYRVEQNVSHIDWLRGFVDIH